MRQWLDRRTDATTARPGTAPKCSRCRYGVKPPRVTQAMRDYWLERFPLEEIRGFQAGSGAAGLKWWQ